MAKWRQFGLLTDQVKWNISLHWNHPAVTFHLFLPADETIWDRSEPAQQSWLFKSRETFQIQVVYLGHLPGGCSQPQTCCFLHLPLGLHRLPWYKSMLVTMVTGVKSGHLVQPYDAAHSYTPHIVRICLLTERTFRCASVWWFGGHAWWSWGSLRPDYGPTNQLADHMDGNLNSALRSASPVPPLTPSHAQVYATPPSLHHSRPADLLIPFNESLGLPALRWKFHPRHPPSVILCFISCS